MNLAREMVALHEIFDLKLINQEEFDLIELHLSVDPENTIASSIKHLFDAAQDGKIPVAKYIKTRNQFIEALKSEYRRVERQRKQQDALARESNFNQGMGCLMFIVMSVVFAVIVFMNGT